MKNCGVPGRHALQGLFVGAGVPDGPSDDAPHGGRMMRRMAGGGSPPLQGLSAEGVGAGITRPKSSQYHELSNKFRNKNVDNAAARFL